MARTFLIVLVVMVVTATPASAHVTKTPCPTLAPRPGEIPDQLARNAPAPRSDTLWFGGDDGNGLAVEGGVWDWDTNVPPDDPFQGWSSQDMTENEKTYFAWVNADSFATDPCNPCMFVPCGMLWCGIHEAEAVRRDFIGGMGYQNAMCQYALSPEYAINPSTQPISINFAYFNDSELGFDYTYVQLMCYDVGHVQLPERDGVYEVDYFDGIIGSPQSPAAYARTLQAATLPSATSFVRLRLLFESDGAWSDEDGRWDSACGPFACDNLTLQVGSTPNAFDWNDGPQGWTFSRCPGVGTYMSVIPESVWHEWLDYAGVLCDCNLDGNALGFVDIDDSPYWPPGHPVGHLESASSGIIVRPNSPPGTECLVRWDQYVWLRYWAGTYYRPGWKIYPYTSEVYPEPHWSPRLGQDVWYYTGDTPDCYATSANLSHPPDGDPLPADWDSLRAVFDIVTSCDMFAIWFCNYEGETYGSPLIDEFRLGMTYAPDAPTVNLDTGARFMDGFGQRFPLYLEPSDVGNSNITYDLSRDDPHENDWLGDIATVSGPNVTDESNRYVAEMCFRMTRAGPRQHGIPGYEEWKSRFTGDPEVDWVCARMDSFQDYQGPSPRKYNTYFHESDPGFDPRYPDRRPQQEILPDSLFTPGTRIEYYYRSSWYNGGAPAEEYSVIGPMEFEILPGMQAAGSGYDWAYPCVLYIDAYNLGSESYILPMLDEIGLSYDRYDDLDCSSGWDAPFRRSYGGTTYNPGGWGNNGCTVNQLLGYRLILVNFGNYAEGCWMHNYDPGNPDRPDPNATLLEDWLQTTECGFSDLRRGLILNGDGVGYIFEDIHPEFAHTTLGFNLVADSYREYNDDDAGCVYLEPSAGAEFSPQNAIGLYGNGCPHIFDYNVLNPHTGVSDVTGNLRYYSYGGTGLAPYVDYAQVVRDHVVPGEANWKSVADGFSLHHLSRQGWGGADCSSDSESVVSAGIDLLIPEILGWISDPDDPFAIWRYPCSDTGIGDGEESHLSGPVTYLYASRPNPFTGVAAIRFSLAQEGRAHLTVYDATGRQVRKLIDGNCPAGEQTLIWDGLDDGGHRASTGIYWMQLRAANGYESSRKVVVLQ